MKPTKQTRILRMDIEPDLKYAFKSWCYKRGLSMKDVLVSHMKRCVTGKAQHEED